MPPPCVSSHFEWKIMPRNVLVDNLLTSTPPPWAKPSWFWQGIANCVQYLTLQQPKLLSINQAREALFPPRHCTR